MIKIHPTRSNKYNIIVYQFKILQMHNAHHATKEYSKPCIYLKCKSNRVFSKLNHGSSISLYPCFFFILFSAFISLIFQNPTSSFHILIFFKSICLCGERVESTTNEDAMDGGRIPQFTG